jgi:hypothetical protein
MSPQRGSQQAPTGPSTTLPAPATPLPTTHRPANTPRRHRHDTPRAAGTCLESPLIVKEAQVAAAGVATGANRALHRPPCPCHTPPNNSPPRQHTPQTPPRHATSSGHMSGVTSDRQRGTGRRSGGRNRRQQGPPPPSLPLPHPSQQFTAPPTHPADTATTRHEQRAHVWSHL